MQLHQNVRGRDCRAEKKFSLLSLEHMSAVQNMVDGAQDRNRVLFLTTARWEFLN